jgi:hypothetical protein
VYSVFYLRSLRSHARIARTLAHVRAGLGELPGGRAQVVDVLLLRGAPAHVLLERGELALLVLGALEHEQLGERLLELVVLAHALLQEGAELGPEHRLELLRVLLGELGQLRDEAAGEGRLELGDEARVLRSVGGV